ncbi:MAG: RNA polymerase sigma-70 factor [Marinifilaceae bacterium]
MSLTDLKNDQLKLLQNGNEEVFKEIFHTHFHSLYYYAKDFVVRDAIAKEIVQESFLTLWEKKDNLLPNTIIRAYLFSITRNKCLNYLKHIQIENNHKELTKKESLELQLNEIALEYDGNDLYVAKELQKKITQSIDSLPDQCKKIFQMSRWESLKYSEIAEKLNLSVKTVENQMSKALRLLRENLKSYL